MLAEGAQRREAEAGAPVVEAREQVVADERRGLGARCCLPTVGATMIVGAATAAVTADGPGSEKTGILCLCAAATRRLPGSEITGSPQSESKATDSPCRIRSMRIATLSRMFAGP